MTIQDIRVTIPAASFTESSINSASLARFSFNSFYTSEILNLINSANKTFRLLEDHYDLFPSHILFHILFIILLSLTTYFNSSQF